MKYSQGVKFRGVIIKVIKNMEMVKKREDTQDGGQCSLNFKAASPIKSKVIIITSSRVKPVGIIS